MNFELTGLLVIAGGLGLRCVLRGRTARFFREEYGRSVAALFRIIRGWRHDVYPAWPTTTIAEFANMSRDGVKSDGDDREVAGPQSETNSMTAWLSRGSFSC